jgi:hypothetical protein
MEVNIVVAVRCRPLSSREVSRGCQEIANTSSEKNTVSVHSPEDPDEVKVFSFDQCYPPGTPQSTVFSDLGAPTVSKT